jgi:hypothetical protein
VVPAGQSGCRPRARTASTRNHTVSEPLVSATADVAPISYLEPDDPQDSFTAHPLAGLCEDDDMPKEAEAFGIDVFTLDDRLRLFDDLGRSWPR